MLPGIIPQDGITDQVVAKMEALTVMVPMIVIAGIHLLIMVEVGTGTIARNILARK